jgi:hypothetical protein
MADIWKDQSCIIHQFLDWRSVLLILVSLFDLVVLRVVFLDCENLSTISAHVFHKAPRENKVNVLINLGIVLLELLNVLFHDIFVNKVDYVWEHTSEFFADLVKMPLVDTEFGHHSIPDKGFNFFHRGIALSILGIVACPCLG